MVVTEADSVKANKEEEEEEESLEIPDVLLDTKSEEAAVEYIAGCITRKVLIYKMIKVTIICSSSAIRGHHRQDGQPYRVMVDSRELQMSSSLE